MTQVSAKRKPDTHKGDYGHVLVVAGSVGMTGAAYLASEAALVTGSGLVTCAIPKSLNGIMEVKLTEVMTLPVNDNGKGRFSAASFSQIKKFAEKVDAAAIGPGISRAGEVRKLVKKLIRGLGIPIILDADGINCIVDNPEILRKIKKSAIITPHPGEMSRLVGKDVNYIQKNREAVARETAKKYGITVVLKGMNTVIASEGGDVYLNKTGNAGMASGGVGDLLTGMIASLMGQGFTSFDAAKCAAYLHGLAGDIAARIKGQVSLRAMDVLENIPQAIKNG